MVEKDAEVLEPVAGTFLPSLYPLSIQCFLAAARSFPNAALRSAYPFKYRAASSSVRGVIVVEVPETGVVEVLETVVVEVAEDAG